MVNTTCALSASHIESCCCCCCFCFCCCTLQVAWHCCYCMPPHLFVLCLLLCCLLFAVCQCLVLRGCLRKYLLQLIAKSQEPNSIRAGRLACRPCSNAPSNCWRPSTPSIPFIVLYLLCNAATLYANASFTFALFTFPHPHPSNGACICDMCKHLQSLQKLQQQKSAGVWKKREKEKLKDCIAAFCVYISQWHQNSSASRRHLLFQLALT